MKRLKINRQEIVDGPCFQKTMDRFVSALHSAIVYENGLIVFPYLRWSILKANIGFLHLEIY